MSKESMAKLTKENLKLERLIIKESGTISKNYLFFALYYDLENKQVLNVIKGLNPISQNLSGDYLFV